MNLTSDSRVLVQGIMEPLGRVYAPLMQTYGTTVIAGVASGHGGDSVDGIPVFDMVDQAIERVGKVDVTVIFDHPYRVLDAALEAIAAGIRQIVIISEGVPPMDMVHLVRKAESTETLLLGANSPGIILPGRILLGTHPADLYTPGPVGVISRSGTLTYEIAWRLTQTGLGQSIVAGIGGDRIVGSSFQQWLQILEEDDQTRAIVLIGEIGGDSEEAAASYIAEAIDKPVIAYIAGRTSPGGQFMGHAGAVIAAQVPDFNGGVGTANSKIAALKAAGAIVAETPSQIASLVKTSLANLRLEEAPPVNLRR